MIGTIQRVHRDDSIDIRLGNGRRLRIAGGYVRAGLVDHGYATTIHKAQGITCDRMFLVGPDGLYREAVYVAMSRARDGAYLYATSRRVAELVERSHASGIPLEAEHVDELDRDVRRAVEESRAKVLAHGHERLLTPIANIADQCDLAWLWQRHIDCRRAAAELVRDGYSDPTPAAIRLERARAHRRFLSPGTRVNAADWDNIGTVIAVCDRTGSAYVEFTSSDGRRRSRKTLDWADLRPVDHPEPVDVTADAEDYFALAQACVDEHAADWHTELQRRGLHPDELHIIPVAIAMRRQRLAHRLAGDPPGWLAWWYGPRPTDPTGAQVWDDEIAQLAAWRDAHHLDPGTPGYGPRPDDVHAAGRWDQHLDRSVNTRHWLRQHTPALPPPAPAAVDIVAVRRRLGELDEILDSAPPDQIRIIDAMRTGELIPGDLDQALLDAATTQHARRQWILEHWPHVVEHAELTRVSNQHDPLAHWPVPPSPDVVDHYRRLHAISTDTPEPTTLADLDRRLADAHPAAGARQLARQRDELGIRLHQLDDIAPHADPEQRVLLDQHRQRLISRLGEIDGQTRRQRTTASMWSTGWRPAELTDAIARRANHLAHHAITGRQPWVYTAIADWHAHHPHGTTGELRSLLQDIAAYRERAGYTGPQPLNPTPAPELQGEWQRLNRGLHQPRTPTISSVLGR
jgi:hypothetical protein